MKIKTSELTDRALDFAAAQAEGHEVAVAEASGLVVIRRANVVDYFDPSTNWGWGGPIIEREKIMFHAAGTDTDTIRAYLRRIGYANPSYSWAGPTHLVAAMRCFVASKLGDEVDVPEELLT